MSAPGEFFDLKLALRLKARVGDQDAWTDLLHEIEATTRMLEADGLPNEEEEEHSQSAWEQLLHPVSFSRRVTMSSSQPMDVEVLLDLNALLSGEQEFLQEAHKLTLAELFEEKEEDDAAPCGTGEDTGRQWREPLTDGELLLQLRAIENQARQTVDKIARLTGSAAFVGPITSNDYISHHGQALLSDFFQVCEWPNEAELHMLTTACHIDEDWNTVEWFDDKREETKAVTRTREILRSKRHRTVRSLARMLAQKRQQGTSEEHGQQQ